MSPGIQAVLALAEIKAAILRFDSGKENAADTLAAILEACKAPQGNATNKREAA